MQKVALSICDLHMLGHQDKIAAERMVKHVLVCVTNDNRDTYKQQTNVTQLVYTLAV